MAALVVDSPGLYPESPNDQEDVVYPCKGCGEILEEGKAFELAGNRWHIDCFRCNTCGTLLDSDANLLLLGDGSLICNNCTYSCNACGNKIEDLAILTGDQAFCASCFRCRNCKRKIENLRYARTSQGIFCMSCHESLMARRRKKAKATPRPTPTPLNAPTPSVEKALPSLPPGAASSSAFSPEAETPLDTHSEAPRSPKERQLKSRKDASINKREVSPASEEARQAGPTLPASTYGDSISSTVSDDTEDGDERGYLPMAFDPTPASAPPPTITRKQVPKSQDASPPVQVDTRLPRDYFSGRLSAKPAPKDGLREEARPPSTRSVSTERESERRVSQPKQSPHILYQEKGRRPKRETSGNNTPMSASTAASPAVPGPDGRPERPKPQHLDTGSFTLTHNEGFKLQEVPTVKKAGSRSNSKVKDKSPSVMSPVNGMERDDVGERDLSASPASLESQQSGVNPFDDPKRKENQAPIAPVVLPPSRHADRPTRGDSLAAAAHKGKSATPAATTEPPTPATLTSHLTRRASRHDRQGSASSVPASFVDAHSSLSSDHSRGKPVEPSVFRPSFDAPPPRASNRPPGPPLPSPAPSKSLANGDFVLPRAPPPPPPADRHKNGESTSTVQSSDARSDGQLSPVLRSAGLPKHSLDGSFSMDEDMARILRGDRRESHPTESAGPSVLRRVSNAVKHGRSFSDRGLNSTSKSHPRGSIEIGSPITIGSPHISSPTQKDPLEQLRGVLKRTQQQVAELEAENHALRERLNSSADLKAADGQLREKRNTIIVLDTQREMVVAELESMTMHLQKVKESRQPLDVNALKSDVARDFAESLSRLKDHMGGQIETLMHQRNELTEEIANLIQMKDRGFQEYESLTNRNQQLLDMNDQLVHGMQDTYKANRVPNGGPASSLGANGLGIYHPGIKPETPGPSDVKNLNLVSTDASLPNLLQETEAEPATVLTGPQMVSIRKGQPKKFNWRKGGEKMAKNVTKGIKGAFVGDHRVPTTTNTTTTRDIGSPYGAEVGGVPYGLTTQAAGGSEQSSLNSGKPGFDGPKAPFWQKNGGLKPGSTLSHLKNNSSTNLVPAVDASVLYGSELEARCEYEKRLVPAIVSRCIDEVEARGMDVEGVYRKSGGSGQVKSVQAGFERDGAHDVSDPDLDIHAVTSALKQYFRKLPTPLITYDVYEALLEAGQHVTTGGGGGEWTRERQAAALRNAIADLPEHHRHCLEYLIQHLARVMAHEAENLMTPLNLAVVFAPTIMRPLSIEREMSDMQAQRVAVQALLELQGLVFGEEEEEGSE